MSKQRITLYRAMEEAALLPVGDPKRRAVEEEVASADETIRQTWLHLLSHNESLRLALLRPQPPSGWNERLASLAQPAPVPPASAQYKPLRPVWQIVVFAMFCGWCSGGLAWWWQQPADPLRRLASLAMHDHERNPRMTVQTSRWKELTQQLAPTLPFPLQKPTMLAPLQLVGGRKCKLGQKYVLLSRWKDQQETYSLCELLGPKAPSFGSEVTLFFDGSRVAANAEMIERLSEATSPSNTLVFANERNPVPG